MGSRLGRLAARAPFGAHKFGLVMENCRDGGTKAIRLQKHTRPPGLHWRPGAHKKPWGLGRVGVKVGLRPSKPSLVRP